MPSARRVNGLGARRPALFLPRAGNAALNYLKCTFLPGPAVRGCVCLRVCVPLSHCCRCSACAARARLLPVVSGSGSGNLAPVRVCASVCVSECECVCV